MTTPARDTIAFTEEAVKEYLDTAIRHWRDVRDEEKRADSDYGMATHYIDAFQSVRISLFGELLP